MFSVAIDGPAGAGKSTVAKSLAKELKFIHVDTGALYRVIALFMIKTGIKYTNPKEVIANLAKINIEINFLDFHQRVILNQDDVTDLIRTPEVSKVASDVSSIKEVRQFLLNLQRNLTKEHNVIMDGRDIGTVILPNADVKIFLEASPEQRAKRRYKELVEKNINVSFDQVLQEIKVRDYNDSNRSVAPLKPAEDAITVDSTNLDLQDTINKIKQLIMEKYIICKI